MDKNYILKSYNFDLTKRWYVYVTFKNKANKIECQKYYSGINRGKTVPDRIALADKCIAELKSKVEVVKIKLKTKEDRITTNSEITISFYEALKKVKLRIKASSYKSYSSKVKLFCIYCAKKDIKKLYEIDKTFIDTYFNYLLESRKKNKTFNSYRATLLKIASYIENFDASVFKNIEKVKNVSIPAKFFTEKQKSFLLGKFEEIQPRLSLICKFIYFTLIRPGELRLLKIGDIDLIERKIIVRGEISKNGYTQTVAIPKEFLPDLLKLDLDIYPEHFYIFGKERASKTPVSRDYFAKQHQKLLRELEFDTKLYKFYSWKHTGAIGMVKAGIHIKYIQMQGRWHDLDQVNCYLRQMGMIDMEEIINKHKLLPYPILTP